MRKVFIIVFFSIIAVNLYSNGIPLSTVSDTNTYTYMKGRQMINVNFSTGWAGFLTGFLNAVTYDFEVTSNFAKLNFNLLPYINSVAKYMHNMDFKASMWYIPNIAYTYLHRENLGFEVAIGVQSMSFDLTMKKNKLGGLLDENTSLPAIEDSTFESSYTYIPISFGVKLFTGKKRRTVNTFRIGFEPVVYRLKTKNGLTGETTDKTYRNFNMYLSYELGWSIELFPTREWKVKPYFDISLFEIGYYVKSSAHLLYRDTYNHMYSFANGTTLFSDLSENFPILTLEKNSSFLPYVLGIRFIFLPRIGFSLRF